ncbi:MAG: molybdenum cofactor biosynthesis protein MoaE [Rhodospirillaceae bacterium]|nr:molybdenum cofactor biosynthesis protein MoaE [Rhodospirillaceae bacterium]
MIRVQSQDFDAGAEIAASRERSGDAGGLCSFIGVVREGAGPQQIIAMTLEHYPGMTEKELASIEGEARERWPLEDVVIIHRIGRLVPGDQIVLVLTASAHRKAAIEAAEFLIDWLKTKAPFWKSEEAVGETRWVAARASDDEAAAKWD